jgi:hypothetical protein
VEAKNVDGSRKNKTDTIRQELPSSHKKELCELK